MTVEYDTSPASSPTRRTNTVTITSLPRSFFTPAILELLQGHFASYGEINRWVPLPAFARIMVIYQEDSAAEKAKLHSDPIFVQGTAEHEQVKLRVFRADRNPLLPRHVDGHQRGPEIHYLQPPEVEKNFLISPPGSPPVGWEQIREDPPNSTPLANDLMTALRKLKIQEQQEEQGQFEMLLHPDEAGVGVYVEDCDATPSIEVRDEDWVYGQTMPTRQRWQPIPTAMPPIASVLG